MSFKVGDFFALLGCGIALTGIYLIYPPAALIIGGSGLAALGYLSSK